MKKTFHPAILGAFVVGAAGLLVLSIILFGGGNILTYRPRFVIYFPGSVQGLASGAPVLFRGVQVGTVISIAAVYKGSSKEIHIPVVCELDREKIQGLDAPLKNLKGEKKIIHELGLRAQLISQSFVTGQKAVALDFLPETEVVLHSFDSEYAEIPAIASPLDKLSEKLENLPLDKILHQLDATLVSISRLIEDPALREGIGAGKDMLQQWASLGALWKERSAPLAENADQLLEELTRRVKAADVEKISNDLESVAQRTDKVIGDVQQLIGPGAQVDETLREFQGAARELRKLLEYLGRHPEALVQGKTQLRDSEAGR